MKKLVGLMVIAIFASTAVRVEASWEGYGWVGYSSMNKSSYYGGKVNLYFQQSEKIGVGMTANGWNSNSNDSRYDGNRLAIGPIVRLVKTKIAIQYGQQENNSHKENGYSSCQKTDVACLSLSKSWPKIELSLEARKDVGHKSESWKNGKRISGSNGEASKDYFGGKCFWMNSRIFVKSGYSGEDHSFSKSVGVSKKITGGLLTSANVELRNISNSKYSNNNGYSLNIGINIGK